MDEGYIKYQCNWKEGPAQPAQFIFEVNMVRDELIERNLIGEYPGSGIGFGNISIRHPERSDFFIISGTQTGGIRQLDPEHYALVTAWNLDKNVVHCEGPLKASSEALTHAGIYAISRKIKSVIHIHHANLWNKLKNDLPTTPDNVAYGSVEMANWMRELYENSDLKKTRILVMGGHEDGLISFGNSCEEALGILIHFYNKIQP